MIKCEKCKAGGRKAEYTGETARTPYLRGRKHEAGERRRDEDNALWKHKEEHHRGEEGVTFSMKIVATYRTPLARQVGEAVHIQESKAEICMNSKAEYNGVRIPRVVVEVGGVIMGWRKEAVGRRRGESQQ